jgi:radical SAM protein with 4Fe4S-binding SPASM domain
MKNELISMYYKMKGTPKFPPVVAIEPTNFCNYKCVMCPVVSMRRTRGFLDFELFKKIADECAEYKKNIEVFSLTGNGESLTNPRIMDMVGYAKTKDFKEVRMTTNGFFLTEKNIDTLLEKKIDHLVISMNAATRGTYEKVTMVDSFDRVESNVKYLLKRKKELGVKKPFVTLRMTKMDITENEIDDFEHRWKDKADSVSVSEMFNWAGAINRPKTDFNYTGVCGNLWSEMVIMFNGDVALCCWDYEGAVKFGNITNATLFDIWHGEQFEAYRKSHLSNEISTLPLCKDCERFLKPVK